MNKLRLTAVATVLCAQLVGLWSWATAEVAPQAPSTLAILFFLLALVHLFGFILCAIALWDGMGGAQ
jgi:hypothetical protein